jgi:putative flippase GtrA
MVASTTATAPIRAVSLAARYVLFAAVATAINLLAQFVVLSIVGGPYRLMAAMAIGTAAGILPKYLLDKRWIFQDASTGLGNHARKFTLYTLLSVATTLVFWATEALFDWIGEGGSLKYLGAVLGLGAGYWIKYHLDRRITFGATT